MTKPLSIMTYYRRNKRKVLPVVLILAFSIVGITSTSALTDEIFLEQESIQNSYQSYDTVTSSSKNITFGHRLESSDEYIEHKLSSCAAVDYYVKSVVQDVRFVRVLGDNGVPVFFIAPQDNPVLLNQFDWKIVSGSVPRSGTNEIDLSINIMKNRGWHVGETIGSNVDRNEFLPGSYKIVGELGTNADNKLVVSGGIGALNFATSQSAGFIPYTYLVHPKAGQAASLDRELNTLQERAKEVAYASESTILAQYASDYDSAKVVLGLVNSIVVIVISVSVALLFIIFLMQRANEFGLLAAIGYGRSFIIRKVLLESVGQVVIGWTLGLLIAQGVYALFNAGYFTPHGLLGVNVFSPVPLLFSLPVPLVVVLVTATTIFVQLSRFDPIAIIERRD